MTLGWLSAHHHHVEPDPGILGTSQEDTVSLLVYGQPDGEVASLGRQVHVLNVGQLHLQSSGQYSHSLGKYQNNLPSTRVMDGER